MVVVMAKAYRSVDRDQRFLLPPDMCEWLPGEHLVWFLLDVVARLDTGALHQRPRRAGQGPATGSAAGRAGYDPDMLLGLLIYAYACGEQSSRHIERLCHSDVAFRVLCAGDIPDHTVIARFRRDHQEVFTDLFAQVLRLCARAGLGQVGTVAIDGSKFAANAAKAANHDRDWFTEKQAAEKQAGEKQAAQEAAAQRTAAAADTDVAEDALFGPARGDEVPTEYHDPRSRGSRIQSCLAELEAEDAARTAKAEQRAARAQESVARHEATVARLRAEQQDKIDRWQAEMDAQAAHPTFHLKPSGQRPRPVDDAARVRRAEDRLAKARARAARTEPPSAEPASSEQATPGSSQPSDRRPVRNLTDPDSRLMTSSHGWIQGYNVQFAISADQLVLATCTTQDPTDPGWLIPMMHDAVTAAASMATAADPQAPVDEHGGIGLFLADAGYNSDDNLAAPGPDRLIALGKRRDQTKTARDHPTSGDPPPGADPRTAMDHRLRTPEGHATYKRRGATVEPGIGNIKKLLAMIGRRGLAAAGSEVTLAALTHNLRKLYRASAPAT